MPHVPFTPEQFLHEAELLKLAGYAHAAELMEQAAAQARELAALKTAVSAECICLPCVLLADRRTTP